MDSDEDSFYDAADTFDDVGDDGWKAPAASTGSATPATTVPTNAPPAPEADALENLVAPGAPDEPQEPYPLHRAAWYGQVELVKRLAAGASKEYFTALDSHGNTAMHVAVMRRQRGVVEALLAAGCPAGTRNSRGWVPLMEAVELGDRELAAKVARAEVEQMRNTVKAKKAALLALLRSDLPDFSLQLKWELNSSMPGVGALVRRYAPHDTYTLWKKGGRIRVDGSLMGVDEDSSSLVPGFKRGHFSLLYDASGDKPKAMFVNHSNKTFIDVKTARKKAMMTDDTTAAVLEDEIDVLMTSEVLQHKKLRSVDFRFKPISGWLTKEVREKVEGWNCKVYEAAGRLVAVSRYKMPYGLTPDMSYDDYLAASFEVDPVVESPVNPMNPSSLKDRGSNPAKAAAKLAVAAKHQRIAAAAAAAQNQEAARIATAAAARAAAGGLRALAPQPQADGEEDEEDDEAAAALELQAALGAGGDDGDGASTATAERGGGGRRGAVSPRSSRMATVHRRDTAGSAATKGGGGSAVSRHESAATVVVGKPTPTPSGKGMEGGGGGGGSSKGLPQLVFATPDPGGAVAATATATHGSTDGGDDSGAQTPLALPLDVDLTALAAKVAAEAEAAKAGARSDDDDAAVTAADGAAGHGPEYGRDGTAAGGKAGRLLNGSSPSRGRPAADKAGKAGAAGGRNGAEAPSSGGAGSGKGWRNGLSGWGFSKKTCGGDPQQQQQQQPSGVGSAATEGRADAAAAGAGGGGGGAKAGPTYGAAGAAAKKSKKISGRCWMAESFPLSLTQLVPLLEVVGTANKAFAKVARFMRKYGDLAMFPVKVHVPIILTIYMVLSFKQFRLMTPSRPGTIKPAVPGAGGQPHQQPIAPPEDSFFEIPEGYIEATLENRDPRGPAAASTNGDSDAGGVGGKRGRGGSKGGNGGRGDGDGRVPGGASRELSLLHRDVVDDEMGIGGAGLGLDD